MSFNDLDIDAILEGDDTEAIEALLDQMEETDDGIVFKEGEADAATEGDDLGDAAEAEGAEPSAESSAESEGDSSGDKEAVKDAPVTPEDGSKGNERPVIEGKHGNNTIPYSELEAARRQAQDADRRAQEAEQRIQELEQQAGKNERMERQLDVLTKQLEEHGLEAESLPEDYQLTEEKQRELIEDYGEMGKAMVAMYARMAQAQPTQPDAQSQTAEQQGADPEHDVVMQAISRNADLEAWRTGDGTRWQEAVRIDQILQADKQFANTSLDERFAEAVRRTKAVFGDAVPSPDDGKPNNQQQLDEKVREAEEAAAPPPSLSDMGVGATGSDRPLVEQMADLSEDELAERMAGMTEKQREALLSQIS